MRRGKEFLDRQHTGPLEWVACSSTTTNNITYKVMYHNALGFRNFIIGEAGKLGSRFFLNFGQAGIKDAK